jgi:basic membrane protein A and related proteins
VTKAITTEVKTIVLAAAHGHDPASYTGTLANGGVALAPYHSFNGKIPAALKTALKAVKAKIESGKIVPATKGQF